MRPLVMIPAFNEERSVGIVVRQVKESELKPDVLVIDDGSTDGTALAAADAGASVLSLAFHVRGTGAVLCGYMVAMKHDYDYLVKIDADGQHKVEDLERLLGPLQKNEADITVGSRYVNGVSGEDTAIKVGGRVLSSFLIDRLVRGYVVTDVTSGYRAWTKRALSVLLPEYLSGGRLPEDSVLWLTETVMSSRRGLRIMEVPIEVRPRMFGKSKSFSSRRMMKYPLTLVSTYIRLSRFR